MGEVIQQQDRYVRLSIARLADEFGMARETVSKRLSDANVKADGKRAGYPVYRLKDACPALVGGVSFDDEGQQDPRSLQPISRKAWYQSEIARLNVEATAGQLIPAAEVESEMASLVKTVVQFLDTLGDQLERDCGLTPEQVVRVQAGTNALRQQMYEAMAEDDVRLSA